MIDLFAVLIGEALAANQRPNERSMLGQEHLHSLFGIGEDTGHKVFIGQGDGQWHEQGVIEAQTGYLKEACGSV